MSEGKKSSIKETNLGELLRRDICAIERKIRELKEKYRENIVK